MQLHNLIRRNPNKKSQRIGRGGKRGKTSGRGHKGQNARAGTSGRPEMRDIIKKIPKLRGYQFKSFALVAQVVNVSDLEAKLEAGEVNVATLKQAGLIGTVRRPVKILGDGEVKKAFTITGCRVSNSAKEKIEKAGGKIVL